MTTTAFPITREQFHAWLAEVAATQPGREFAVDCDTGCLISEAIAEICRIPIVSVGTDRCNFYDNDNRLLHSPSITMPRWASDVVEWFDGTYKGVTDVAAATIWPAFCARFNIAPPPVEPGTSRPSRAQVRAALAARDSDVAVAGAVDKVRDDVIAMEAEEQG